jgi:hypothetical protein
MEVGGPAAEEPIVDASALEAFVDPRAESLFMCSMVHGA